MDQSKRKKCVIVNTTDRIWRAEEYFGIRYGDAEFEVYPAGFWSCFDPVFLYYASFWNGQVHPMSLYAEHMRSEFLFCFHGRLKFKRLHESQKKL